jgi:hypothetical protein
MGLIAGLAATGAHQVGKQAVKVKADRADTEER